MSECSAVAEVCAEGSSKPGKCFLGDSLAGRFPGNPENGELKM